MVCQKAVVVLPLSCDFSPNPRRQLEVLAFATQFDFGNDKPQVLA
jgi:hypothetical protein